MREVKTLEISFNDASVNEIMRNGIISNIKDVISNTSEDCIFLISLFSDLPVDTLYSISCEIYKFLGNPSNVMFIPNIKIQVDKLQVGVVENDKK